MKKYIVFAGNDYYPRGGWNDFLFSVDNLEDLEDILGYEKNSIETFYLNRINNCAYDWLQVVDYSTGEIISNVNQYLTIL